VRRSATSTRTPGATVSLNPYSDALELTGTASGLNVFSVNAAELAQVAGIVIDLTQPGATALINTTLLLTPLCIDYTGDLDVRMRNTGDQTRHVTWTDLTGSDFG